MQNNNKFDRLAGSNEMEEKQTFKGGAGEEPNKLIKQIAQEKYKYGFTTDVHTEVIERGLNEDIVRLISAK